MKSIKTPLFLTAFLCALLFSQNVFAQMDEREPGIYAVVNGESLPLNYSNGIKHNSSTGILGIELGKKKCTFKEPTSGIAAADTFVMVINPEKKNIVRNMRSYNPFVKSMTPDNILIVPLSVDGNKRVYEEGKTVGGITVTSKERIEFEWEQISDNSFEIRIPALTPGEYAFVFRTARLAEFDYSAIFGFTIPGQNGQDEQNGQNE